MQAKCLWIWVQWELFNVFDIIRDLADWNRLVNARLGQMVVIFQHAFVHVAFKNNFD